MYTIWKFETIINGQFKDKITISMPKDAKILCVQLDGKTNIPCIWAEVNTDKDSEDRLFELFGTGTEIPYNMGVVREYIGTYQYQNGDFVGHIFERIN